MAVQDWENWRELMGGMLRLTQRAINAVDRQLGAASERFDAYMAAEAESSATDSGDTDEDTEEDNSKDEDYVVSGTEE